MNAAEIVAIVKDIIVAIAAGIAAYVGIRGLNTWRRQLAGNTEYQLARNILTSVYELRDAIIRVRDPFMSYSAEPDLSEEKLRSLDRADREWHAMAQAYQKRWDPIPPVMSRLNTNLWEAEAVWPKGKVIATKARELNALLNQLFWAIQTHLRNTNPTNREGVRRISILEQQEGMLYARQKDDEFRNKVDAVATEIEKELRPHITKHHG
jgi:hypothetical protein